MSLLKMLLGKHAPTHYAEVYTLAHDKTLNLVEARRGRGKSYGAVKIALSFLKELIPTAGTRPHAKVYANNKFNVRRMALYICQQGWMDSHAAALEFISERVVYITSWLDVLTAYDSLILMDEANRNLNVYDNGKDNQVLMIAVHDWLQQTRKHKLTLWFFVQNLEWIKPQLKMLMDRLWRAKRVMNKKTKMVKSFPWYGSDPFGNGVGAAIVRNADFKMRWPFELEIARMYDTLQAIATLPPTTDFANFAEMSDYMYAHGLKPLPSPTISDALTHAELIEWFNPAPVEAAPLAASAAFFAARVSVPLASPGNAGGGGGSGVLAGSLQRLQGPAAPPGYFYGPLRAPHLPPPPVDLSGLAVTAPKACYDLP